MTTKTILQLDRASSIDGSNDLTLIYDVSENNTKAVTPNVILSGMTILSSMISDATTFGRSLLTAASASAARTLLGLGTTSTLNVGTSANNVVQLDSSAKLPAVDGSNLTNLTAAQGPLFRATLSSQSVPASTTAKLSFSTETYDTDNCYDNVTNYRFTPTKAGYYLINLQIVSVLINSNTFNLFIRKNGTTTLSSSFYMGMASASETMSVSDIVYLNGTTDYVEAYFQNGYSGSSVTLSGSNCFQGTYLRA